MRLILPILLVLPAVVVGSSRTAMAGPVEDCLAATGLAHVTSSSSLLAGTGFSYVFGGPNAFVSCDLPKGESQELGSGGSVAAVSHAAGVGGIVSTAALSPPFAGGSSTGIVTLGLLYSFEVIPDDPQSTDPVTIDIVARHRYPTAVTDSSGSGIASNQQLTYYELRQLVNGGYVGPTWTNAFPVVNESYVDIHHTVDVPVNTSLYLLAEITQRSDANPGSSGGSASATLNAQWTFEVTTEDAASVHFDVEDLLGLAAPQIDHVPEPALGPALAPFAALCGCLATRRRIG